MRGVGVTARPVPARITMALDLRGLYGPEVDVACGAVEPAVDLWELGLEVPTWAQLELLSKLVGIPVPWFFRPVEQDELIGSGWICIRGRGGSCTPIVANRVDENGVLHYGGEPDRLPPENFQTRLF